MKKQTDIARLALRRVAYNPEVAKIIGLNEAILLGQLDYWSDKTVRTDGWFWKTKQELTDETCLSRFQQDQARKKLEKLGLVESKVMRAMGKPTLHYRIAFQNVRNLLFETLETSLFDSLETDVSITESTQESTTENKRKASGPTKEEMLENFTLFYATYPNKKGKGFAESAWLRIKPDDDKTKEIINKVEAYKTTKAWNKDGGKFIPYPATFLNQRRYEDDLSTEPKQDASTKGDTLSLT